MGPLDLLDSRVQLEILDSPGKLERRVSKVTLDSLETLVHLAHRVLLELPASPDPKVRLEHQDSRALQVTQAQQEIKVNLVNWELLEYKELKVQPVAQDLRASEARRVFRAPLVVQAPLGSLVSPGIEVP